MSNPRIISLLPGCTEIVCALGLTEQVIGRSHACDYPTAVRHLPACTSPRLNTAAPGHVIDQEVKTRLRTALSVYPIDVELMKRLQPDIILTQDQCEVCAVSLKEVQEALSQWMDSRPRVLSLATLRLADLWDNIRLVAEALDVAERGKELTRTLKNRCVDVIEKACQVKHKPSVACLEWLDPLMAAGNWMPELVELAGGLNLFGETGKHSPWLNWEAVRDHDPEVMVVMPCGFNLARTRAEMPALTSKLDWGKLRSVRDRRVCLTDGNQYFNRPGPRLVDSLEILAEILHPDRFHFGYRGEGWEKF